MHITSTRLSRLQQEKKLLLVCKRKRSRDHTQAIVEEVLNKNMVLDVLTPAKQPAYMEHMY